jgi:hypothetical protein
MENNVFSGKLWPENWKGGSTPREWSPYGVYLQSAKTNVVFLSATVFFTYFQDCDATIVEGLVIPMYAAGLPIGTIWIISHDERRRFDAEDVRIMTSLGSFVTASLRRSGARGATWEVILPP